MTVVPEQRDSGRRKSGRRNPGSANSPAGRTACAPVAALLFEPSARPSLADLVALSRTDGVFGITHQNADEGHAELLRDGLTFDCHGLAPGAPLRMDTALQLLTLPGDFAVADHALVTLGPGAHLAGAGQLLPVVRVLAGLALVLSELPGLRAIAWLPARLAMSPAWFAEAVGIWLKGGPFPALALTGLARSEGSLVSHGLSYFVGQEFIFSGKDGNLRESDARGACLSDRRDFGISSGSSRDAL